MGIKFRCPNGHKLNVKSFLAGKRGVCPDCQATFRIPQDPGGSDVIAVAIPSLKPGNGSAATGEPSLAGAVDIPVTAGRGEREAAVDRPAVATAATMTAAVGTAPKPAATATAAASPRIAAPVAAAPVTPPTTPVLAAVPLGAPVAASAVAAVPVKGAAPVPAPVALAGPPAAVPAAPAGDPIAEAPTAIWYVRPPSGGQYGPARGEVMSRWIAEGRVSGDSLVWREGYTDWRSAGQLFPSLGSATAPAIAAPAAVAPAAARSTSRYAARKKSGNGMAIAALVGLVVVCVVLVGVLVVVLTQQAA